MPVKQRIDTPHMPPPPPQTWSNCLVVGNQVFLAGMADNTAGNDMYGQAKNVFTKMKHNMEAAGGKMDDIVKVTIFVTDHSRREEVWKARREFFTGDFPVSTLVQVDVVGGGLGFLVEIEAVGFLGAGG